MNIANVGKVAVLLLLSALSVAAQGTVHFENNIPGILVTHVYAVNPLVPLAGGGNGPSDYPPWDHDWTGWTPAAGSGFSAQLLAAPGAYPPPGSLKPASPITTFQTGANAGFVIPLIATLEGVPADAPVATIVMVAWDNQNGTTKTWEEAYYSAHSFWGMSGALNVFNIGGAVNPPPILQGLQSFTMGEFIAIPEPSSLALLGVGFFALLVGRRTSSSL
jgi:hypothetical protein